ncbi:hypothetical protein CFP56_024881 [Quercus suber]|uniref:Uncharacterized protein n=1 Tax=Quercus suber TaxID=58331 RepID=A0AAW0K4G1_QUESU
MASPESVLPW